MWFEARKQEKKIRSIMIDHKKRAERRRLFYERIVSCLHFKMYHLFLQCKIIFHALRWNFLILFVEAYAAEDPDVQKQVI
ncbi:unnamed protein product [Soboliphyme baturini]|uniref:Uncharacterized protein n=1 Tax=Soboliphyme baturini TaxID=241478 RepID=A0A183IAH6_9BILA|nr:unnamed protein product [Soboliphyme baturini]